MRNDEKSALLVIALFLSGCAGENLPQHIEWVRADGKPLSSQFDRDATACRDDTQKANDPGDAGPSEKKTKVIDGVFVRCMTRRGYVEFRQDIR